MHEVKRQRGDNSDKRRFCPAFSLGNGNFEVKEGMRYTVARIEDGTIPTPWPPPPEAPTSHKKRHKPQAATSEDAAVEKTTKPSKETHATAPAANASASKPHTDSTVEADHKGPQPSSLPASNAAPELQSPQHASRRNRNRGQNSGKDTPQSASLSPTPPPVLTLPPPVTLDSTQSTVEDPNATLRHARSDTSSVSATKPADRPLTKAAPAGKSSLSAPSPMLQARKVVQQPRPLPLPDDDDE